jgi:hypothetical protein
VWHSGTRPGILDEEIPFNSVAARNRLLHRQVVHNELNLSLRIGYIDDELYILGLIAWSQYVVIA